MSPTHAADQQSEATDRQAVIDTIHRRHLLAQPTRGAWWTLGGRYDHRLTRRPEGGRIAAVRLTVLWGEGNQKLPELAAAISAGDETKGRRPAGRRAQSGRGRSCRT